MYGQSSESLDRNQRLLCRMRSHMLVGLCCALLFAGVATAQEQRGSIDGVVKDSSGGVLPGVTVEAHSAGVGQGSLRGWLRITNGRLGPRAGRVSHVAYVRAWTGAFRGRLRLDIIGLNLEPRPCLAPQPKASKHFLEPDELSRY